MQTVKPSGREVGARSGCISGAKRATARAPSTRPRNESVKNKLINEQTDRPSGREEGMPARLVSERSGSRRAPPTPDRESNQADSNNPNHR